MKQNDSISYLLLIGLLAFIPTSYGQNNDALKVSRYGFLSLAPKAEQINVLSVIVEFEFPREIQKVGDALAFLLENSGYRLEDPEQSGRHQYVLYNFDLPEAHRKIGPITLWDALSVIGNDGFLPRANPILRTVRFELGEVDPFEISKTEIACAKDSWINRYDPSYTPCISIEDGEQPPATYGPVRRGEALYRIAESLKIEGAPIEQVMAAIFHANPQAFGNNINVLQEGRTLTIPDVDTIKGTNIECAKQLVRVHFQQWHHSRQEVQHD